MLQVSKKAEATTLSTRARLTRVQCELRVAKNREVMLRGGGRYNYRNCEDIYEAVKPLLLKYELCLTISDELILPTSAPDRIYVKATATVGVAGDNISTSAFAREELKPEYMNEAQASGSASSYARKYALGGLFLTDDNKDPDNITQSVSRKGTAPTTPKQIPIVKKSPAKPEKAMCEIKPGFEIIDQETHRKIEALLEETETDREKFRTALKVWWVSACTKFNAGEELPGEEIHINKIPMCVAGVAVKKLEQKLKIAEGNKDE